MAHIWYSLTYTLCNIGNKNQKHNEKQQKHAENTVYTRIFAFTPETCDFHVIISILSRGTVAGLTFVFSKRIGWQQSGGFQSGASIEYI